MKTRLQLVKGYLAGTLTKDEKETAEKNHVVMGAVRDMQEQKPEVKKAYKKGAE